MVKLCHINRRGTSFLDTLYMKKDGKNKKMFCEGSSAVSYGMNPAVTLYGTTLQRSGKSYRSLIEANEYIMKINCTEGQREKLDEIQRVTCMDMALSDTSGDDVFCGFFTFCSADGFGLPCNSRVTVTHLLRHFWRQVGCRPIRTRLTLLIKEWRSVDHPCSRDVSIVLSCSQNCNKRNKNLAVANRSRVSYAHNTSRASIIW